MRRRNRSAARTVRVCVRPALALVLLSTGVLQSPALRHVHAGGDRPHHHANSLIEGEREYAPAFGPDHRHQSAALIDAVPHVHLAFLGFELTLPLPDGEEGDQRPDDHFPLFCRIDGHVTPLWRSSDQQQIAAALIDVPGVAAECGARKERDSFFHSQVWRNVPVLCDAARHERSGVQLA